MARSPWTTDHVDFLESMARSIDEPSRREMAARMSKHFGFRVTEAHVGVLLQRMRKTSDPFFRNLPYRRGATRATPWRR